MENIELERSKSNKGIRVALVLAVTNFIIATASVGMQHFYFDGYDGSIGIAAWLWIVWALVMSCVIFFVALQSAKLHRLIKDKYRGSHIALSVSKVMGLAATFLFLCLYLCTVWVNDPYFAPGFFWAYHNPLNSMDFRDYSFDYVTAFGVTLLPAIIFPIFTAAVLWALKSGRE